MSSRERKEAAQTAVKSVLDQATGIAYPLTIEIVARNGQPIRRVELPTQMDAINRSEVVAHLASSPQAHMLRIYPNPDFGVKNWVKIIEAYSPDRMAIPEEVVTRRARNGR